MERDAGLDAGNGERWVATEKRDSSEASNERTGLGEGYGFDRLERALEFLIHEHERLTQEKDELLHELADRESQLRQLEDRFTRERERRELAVEGVDKLLARLDQLRSSVGCPVEAG